MQNRPAHFVSGRLAKVGALLLAVAVGTAVITSKDAPVWPYDNEIFSGCLPPKPSDDQNIRDRFFSYIDHSESDSGGTFGINLDVPLYVSRCGNELVIFNNGSEDVFGGVVYIRITAASGDLISELWG